MRTASAADVTVGEKRDLLPYFSDIRRVPSELISIDNTMSRIKSHVPNVLGGMIRKGLDDTIERLSEMASGMLVDGSDRDENGLTRDEIVALLLYTAHFDVEPHFYSILNQRLREREYLEEFVPYIWLLLNGLKKCPVFPREVVYRGINVEGEALDRLLSSYRLNVPLRWHCFTSTSAKVSIQESFLDEEVLLEAEGRERRLKKGVMFHIHLLPGSSRVISRYSNYPDEEEVLLPPNFKFHVMDRSCTSPGLYTLQLHELVNDQPIIPNEETETFVPLTVEELLRRYRLLGSGAVDVHVLDTDNVIQTVRHYQHLILSKSSAAAQAFLGVCYHHGIVVEKNIEEAVRLYRLSAEQGHVLSQNNLGLCYDNGEGVERNMTEAVRWFRLSADQGYSGAQYNLGVCYNNGSGVVKDLAEAVRWYRLSTDQGNVSAQLHLGWCYRFGNGVDKNMEEAVRLYRLSSDQGNALAQCNLGWCYENGEGVTKNTEEAVRWYRLSANQGNARAQCSLGWYYDNSKGFPKNMEEAVRLYVLSADQGNPMAQCNLGWCYHNGNGVAKNMTEAIRLYRLSADQGNPSAQLNLGWCYYTGEGATKNMEEAVRLYRLSADQGNADAQYYLGVCYEKGEGVAKNMTEAVRWYRRSADKRNARAQYSLGVCYKNGEGVAKDMEEAVRLYRLAADQGNTSAQISLSCQVS